MSSSRWVVRRRPGPVRFSDRLVVQRSRRGVLELSVCLLSRGSSHSATSLLLPLATASTSEGIRRDTGIVSWLQWPDLVTIGGRAVAKTSLSSAGQRSAGEETRITIDISVNCSTARSNASPGRLASTSIKEALGVEIDRSFLLDKILHALDWHSAEWERGMSRKLVNRIEPAIPWIGKDVEAVMKDGASHHGKAARLGEDGSLLLRFRGPTGDGSASLSLAPETVDRVVELERKPTDRMMVDHGGPLKARPGPGTSC